MLQHELKARAMVVDEYFDTIFEDACPDQLYRACTHYIRAGGKRLRPVVVMLTCELTGGENDPLPCAAAVELIHTFTLIHDDIMDQDELRRGIPTVHTVWGEAGAILAGDTLYSKAFETIAHSAMPPEKKSECIAVLSRACTKICEGQWMDISFEHNTSVSEHEYIEMVEKKTAVLYGAAAEVGGIVGGASKDERRALYEFGKLCGIAFQIQDDVLDLVASEDVLGKDALSDIRQGKKTLIAIHALSKGATIPAFGNAHATTEELKRAMEVLESTGSLQYAMDKAQYYLAMAKERLEVFEDCKAKTLLLELADFLVNRGY